MQQREARLTFRLDPVDRHYVPLETFVSALGCFQDLLKTVTMAVRRGRPLQWHVTELSFGSLVTTVDAVGDIQAGVEAGQAVLGGLDLLERGQGVPEHLPSRFVVVAKALAELGGKAKVRLSVAGLNRKVELTQRAVETAKKMLEGTTWEALGSVEGYLEQINIHEQFRFGVYDRFTGKRINVAFSRDMLPAVRQALGCRVEVTGVLRYNRFGEVTSVVADGLTVLSETGYPTVDEMLGIAPGITGELTTEEFLRRIRDHEQ